MNSIFFLFGDHIQQCQNSSWLLSGINPGKPEGPFGLPGIKPGQLHASPRALPTVVSLWPLEIPFLKVILILLFLKQIYVFILTS